VRGSADLPPVSAPDARKDGRLSRDHVRAPDARDAADECEVV
jgi:hypothetical protein